MRSSEPRHGPEKKMEGTNSILVARGVQTAQMTGLSSLRRVLLEGAVWVAGLVAVDGILDGGVLFGVLCLHERVSLGRPGMGKPSKVPSRAQPCRPYWRWLGPRLWDGWRSWWGWCRPWFLVILVWSVTCVACVLSRWWMGKIKSVKNLGIGMGLSVRLGGAYAWHVVQGTRQQSRLAWRMRKERG